MSQASDFKRRQARTDRRRSRAEIAAEVAAMGVVLCPCGRPLHYRSERVRVIVEYLVRAQGTHVRVALGDRAWLIPRHFLALHGLEFRSLPGTFARVYGFRSIEPDGSEIRL